MRFYFAYGSNMWAAQMQDRCPQGTLIGPGILPGYRWIISARGYATVVLAKQAEVQGVVYELTPQDERSLDRYEGVASGQYRKEEVNVIQAGNNLICLVYIDPVTQEGRPRGEYITRINNGLRDADLPASYVEKYIRRFVPAQAERAMQ